MPLFHVTGCVPVMLSCFATGLKLVIMYKWDPERALELIERERVTNFVGVPTQSWDLLESPRFAEFDTSSLVSVGGGGAPAPPELVRRVATSFRQGRPGIGYGMTETNAYGPQNCGADYVTHPTSTGPGHADPGDRRARRAGRPVPVGERGEIWFKGPNLIRGYWNRPDATAETIVDGWLRTGDIGRLDDEGFVYVEDRAKDMVLRGGENVYCAEVEAAIYEHPAVHEAAVFGVPHERLGEEVAAVVVPLAGVPVTAEELQAHVAERLAPFKVPVARSPSGTEPCPATRRARSSSGTCATASTARAGRRRRDPRQRGVDRAEPVLVAGIPVGGGPVHLLAAAADEVPPHDDPLGERLAAEQQCTHRPGGGQVKGLPPPAQVGQRARADCRAPHRQRAVQHYEGVLERGVEGQRDRAAAPGGELRPEQRRVGPGRGRGAGQRADQHGDPGGAEAGDRQLGVVLERGRAVAGALRLRHPQLDAVLARRLAAGRLLGVGDAVAGGHEVELAGPDRLLAAQAVPVQQRALHQPRDGVQAGVGVGSDGHPAGGAGAGPKWSAKHHAPTVRRVRRGSARRTATPPTSASRLGVTSTSGSSGWPQSASPGRASSAATGPLMSFPQRTRR